MSKQIRPVLAALLVLLLSLGLSGCSGSDVARVVVLYAAYQAGVPLEVALVAIGDPEEDPPTEVTLTSAQASFSLTRARTTNPSAVTDTAHFHAFSNGPDAELTYTGTYTQNGNHVTMTGSGEDYFDDDITRTVALDLNISEADESLSGTITVVRGTATYQGPVRLEPYRE